MSLLYCLTLLAMESSWDDNNKVVDNFVSFPENLGSPLLDVEISVHD
jgi:hypothetical protein